MSCLGENTLSDYLELRLTPDELQHMFRHLDECSDCAQLLKDAAHSFHETTRRHVLDSTQSHAPDEPRPGPPLLHAARGTVLGRYVVERVLGFGGMGVVYAARDLQLERLVALKLLRLDGASDGARRHEMLLREAQAMARLQHPNVITVHEVGTFGERVFIAMELVDGETLRDWLKREPRGWRDIVRAFVTAGSGLHAAHEAGLVHRDFKPDNVLVAKSGRICVTDFGLARPADVAEAAPDDDKLEPPASRIAGTPRYMAPEQLAGTSMDRRADIFSFCVALFEALFETPPFPAASLTELRDRFNTGAVEPPPSHGRVPLGVRTVVMRGLRVDREQRPASLQPLLAELGRAARPRSARRFALAAILGVMLLAASALMSLRARPTLQPNRTAALLTLANASANSENAWISTAVQELVGAELHAGDGPKVLPAEDVTRMERELSITPTAQPPPSVLTRIRGDLLADYLVSGSFALAPAGKLRVTLSAIDARRNRTLATVDEEGNAAALTDVALRAGARLRAALGLPALGPRELRRAQDELPDTPEAVRSYARGRLQLRLGDYLGAQQSFAEAVRLAPEHAMSHFMLARAYKGAGYDPKARATAERAMQLSQRLDREAQLSIEALYREAGFEWERAIELERALVAFFPDRPSYALQLARTQARASHSNDCLATVEALRKRPLADPDDPQIDLAEAFCVRDADHRRARDAAARAAAKAERRGARATVAYARYAEGGELMRLGELDRAFAAAEIARQLSHEIGDIDCEASALTVEGSIFGRRGQHDQARQVLEQALLLDRKIGRRSGEMSLLNNIAGYEGDKDSRRGRTYFRQALAIARDIDSASGMTMILGNLATLDGNAGDVRAAHAELAEANELALRSGVIDQRINILSNLAEVMRREQQLASARATANEAIALAEKTKERYFVSEAMVTLALLQLDDGHAAEAVAELQKVAVDARARKLPTLEVLADIALARAERQRGHLKEAAAELVHARAAAAKTSRPQMSMIVDVEAGRELAASSSSVEREQAARLLAATATATQSAGFVLDGREARLALAEVELRQGQRARARAELAALAAEARAAGDELILREADALLHR
jgi:tetratricopeptide (TPR) repeat protein